jgi:hypothetical protein
MKPSHLFLALLLFNSIKVFAGFTSSQTAEEFILFSGKFIDSKNKTVQIETPNRLIEVDRDSLIQYNKTDLRGLLDRNSFKIKVSDIQNIKHKPQKNKK